MATWYLVPPNKSKDTIPQFPRLKWPATEVKYPMTLKNDQVVRVTLQDGRWFECFVSSLNFAGWSRQYNGTRQFDRHVRIYLRIPGCFESRNGGYLCHTNEIGCFATDSGDVKEFGQEQAEYKSLVEKFSWDRFTFEYWFECPDALPWNGDFVGKYTERDIRKLKIDKVEVLDQPLHLNTRPKSHLKNPEEYILLKAKPQQPPKQEEERKNEELVLDTRRALFKAIAEYTAECAKYANEMMKQKCTAVEDVPKVNFEYNSLYNEDTYSDKIKSAMQDQIVLIPEECTKNMQYLRFGKMRAVVHRVCFSILDLQFRDQKKWTEHWKNKFAERYQLTEHGYLHSYKDFTGGDCHRAHDWYFVVTPKH